ncbi:MAG: bifunctional demethylmenaquinone methyltransferase/2-methoxy-6-polyprenyl-1,4-benzoquinol methylase UbiE [Saprospiraceae bacterium]
MTTPYKSSSNSKKDQIRNMFDNISGKYDRLNQILSLGIERSWKIKMVKEIKASGAYNILDIATGTADIAVLMAQKIPNAQIIGLDLSPKMIEVAKKKITKKGLEKRIELIVGDSEALKYKNESFDAVSVSFGVRNFENLEKGISEINRILTKGGKIFVLEFSKPTIFPFKQLFNLYFGNILPKIGSWISKDKSAYTYLFESVQIFPDYKKFTDILEKCGFKNCKWKAYTLGICCLYVGEKV